MIPPAETHVIGDHTPLLWRFVNTESEPIAFMWEGCCRLNGQLTVTAANKRITPVPPSQALAHMFAKAEVLQPSQPTDFDTRISDWVRLHESGTYQLEGRYTGVLPEQSPQVPAHLALWRDRAHAGPIQFSVLSVSDYLAQRPERVARRKLELELDGASRLEPLQPSPLRLAIRNTTDDWQRVIWPNDFQVWIVAPDGHRLGFLPLPVEGSYEELVIPPGGAIERMVPFDHTRVEGEPFASYRVFVDLQAAPNHPRVPSSALDVGWRLDSDDVKHLLLQAARGPRIGLRNPALKLLRVYLAELAPHFASMDLDDATPAVRSLRDQLHLASCLKPFAPDPGRVDLTLAVPAFEPAHLSDSMMESCRMLIPATARVFPHTTLQAILAIRRHLGWELALNIQPDPATSMDTIVLALGPFDAMITDLATFPRALIQHDTSNAPTAVTFRSQPIPANLLLRLFKSGTGVGLEFARKPVSFISLPQAALFRPDEIFNAPFQAVRDRNALDQMLDAMTSPPQTLVLADPALAWHEILDALDPILSRGISLTITVTELTSPVDPGTDDPSS